MAKAIFGKVYLIGAGPGDPGLLTLKGKRCLEQAQVILYDRLVNKEILSFASPDAKLIYCGKKAGGHCLPQCEIEAIMISRAREGKIVVRLKGGDPFIFGRGGEEAEALRNAGVPYEVVPGVSSAIAVPAYAGIPLTHREYSSSVTIVTGHKSCDGKGEVRWEQLACAVDTLVILMGLGNLEENMSRLMAGGCEAERPVALVRWGTRASQETLVGTVGTIADMAEQRNFSSPAVIVVGDVVRFRNRLNWFESSFASKYCRIVTLDGKTPALSEMVATD
jgi:uroporphyrin-III C-methyltransferase